MGPGLVALLFVLGVPQAAPIRWNGRSLELAALPAELASEPRAALVAWHGWASANGYRLELDASGRLLFVCRASNDDVERQLGLARAMTERFERELPAPATRLAAAPPALVAPAPEPAQPAGGDEPIPEDPEDPEGGHPWRLAPAPPALVSSAPRITTWGAQDGALDAQTMVLFLVLDEEHFTSLLIELRARFPLLATWTREARALQGFVLGAPLAAACLEQPAGVEEWNPDNELVNRLARLCLLRRFGELPNWFVQGYAWHVELAQLGAVYVFPWRDEFVWATEHTGWEQKLAARFKKDRLRPSDFMGWRRGRYLAPEAKASWGMCEYLLAKEAAQLPALLDQLRVFREEHGRVQENAHTWRRDPDYEIPVAEQEALFTRTLGPDYLERATAFFRKGLDDRKR